MHVSAAGGLQGRYHCRVQALCSAEPSSIPAASVPALDAVLLQ